jgi:porin
VIAMKTRNDTEHAHARPDRPARAGVGRVQWSLALVCTLAAAGLQATDFSSRDYLTGNWGGLRDRWQAAGVELFLNYTTEPMWNVAGGEQRGSTYLHNIGADVRFDLSRLLGVPSTTLLVKLSKRDGESLSAEYIAPSTGGNIFPVQQIFGGQTFKLANVQLNTRLLNDQLDLAYGRIIANDDFLRSELYCQFLNNAVCGSPKAVFFQDPFAFSAYPSAQWGARARFDTSDARWTLQAGIYDADINLQGGDPGARAHNKFGDSWGLGDNGIVLAGELHYHHNADADALLPGTYKLGGHWMNGDYRDLAAADPATTVQGSAMLWLLAEQMLHRPEPGTERGLWGFGAWVRSLEDRVNLLDDQLTLGLVYRGPHASRPRDSLGFQFTRGWVTDVANGPRRAQGLATLHAESVYELNYRFALGRGISVQPDVQYIQDPAAIGAIPDAWAVGAQVTVDF